jgi:putative CocE/NonD family hydrolase
MGPWAHGVFGGTFVDQAYGIRADSALVDLTTMQLRWFDRWLKNEANDVEHESPVSVFVLGANTWRDERDWPPPDVEFVDYFFHSHGHANTLDGDGMLTAQPPTAEPADMLRYDPNTPVPTWGGATFLPGLHLAANAGPRDQRTIEQREDVLCFTSEPLDEPLLVIGPVEAFVYVSSPAPDLDLTATLVDVEPDGRAINVTDGIVRARYRDSRASPKLLRPGTTYELRIDLGGAACLFRRGHRIRVDISGGSFPRYDRNPQTGEAPGHAVRLQAATHTIHHDAGHASRIVLPVVPLGDA